MTVEATAALAAEFTHAGGTAVTFTFGTAPTSVDVTLAAGTHRMWLAPSASCHLRLLAAAVAAQLTSARGASYTCIASLAADGTFTLRIVSAAALPTVATFAGPVWRRCGFASATPSLSASTGLMDIVGTRPVWHLALLSSVKHQVWQPLQAGGAAQTTGGDVYTIAASLTSYQRSHEISYQPAHPEHRVSQGAQATALLPAPEYMHELGSLTTARETSVADFLMQARNARVSLAPSTWRTLRTSTTEAFFVGKVSSDSLLSPAFRAMQDDWDPWAEWTLGFVLPTTAVTETRA